MTKQRFTPAYPAELRERGVRLFRENRGDYASDSVTCHGIFPPDAIRVRPNLRTDNEANAIYGRADHQHPGRA